MASQTIKPLEYEHGRTLHLFWLSGTWLEGPEKCKPGWSGCMEMLYATRDFQTSAVVPLPFINLALQIRQQFIRLFFKLPQKGPAMDKA
ncbi:hypothetical protein WA026_022765 [Henosepilachna vigintioctopunctata]|uniref:Uncharacterized protein n=1 Tax=Henosepilachna vigintioctopunctata TaxID=420089 RepID=A0AAW1UPI8_9CUCU